MTKEKESVPSLNWEEVFIGENFKKWGRETGGCESRNDGVCQHSHREGKKVLERNSYVQASRVGGSLAHTHI